jgi:hypothetical protein
MSKYSDDDFDEHGVLRDGHAMRVPTMMRDAGPRGAASGDLCTIDGREGRLRNIKGELVCVPLRKSDAARITDGRTSDPLALHRPGYRVPVVNDRRAVNDAYAKYETELCNRYKANDDETLCPQCGGEGYIGGDVCDRCNGEGIIRDDDDEQAGSGYGSSNEGGFGDSRKLDAYQTYDAELSQRWKTP